MLLVELELILYDLVKFLSFNLFPPPLCLNKVFKVAESLTLLERFFKLDKEFKVELVS